MHWQRQHAACGLCSPTTSALPAAPAAGQRAFNRQQLLLLDGARPPHSPWHHMLPAGWLGWLVRLLSHAMLPWTFVAGLPFQVPARCKVPSPVPCPAQGPSPAPCPAQAPSPGHPRPQASPPATPSSALSAPAAASGATLALTATALEQTAPASLASLGSALAAPVMPGPAGAAKLAIALMGATAPVSRKRRCYCAALFACCGYALLQHRHRRRSACLHCN